MREPAPVVTGTGMQQMGVGGDNSWGARTHEKYTLPAKPYSFSFTLLPFSPETESPMELSKTIY